MDHSMIVDRLRAMRKQEDTKYRQRTEHLVPSQSEDVDVPLYIEWRTQMLAWAYTVGSTCKFQNETIEIAMSLVDRFVSIRTELLSDSFAYQVACMAGLYTAAKMNEEHCLTPKQMETLSSNRFSSKDIESMEYEMLLELNWLVNPPTATSFVELLLELVPSHYVPDKKTVSEVAESHLKLAIADVSFLSAKKSMLAFASIISAIHGVVGSTKLDMFVVAFCKSLGYTETQKFHQELAALRRKLRALVLHSLDLGMVFNDGTTATYSQEREHRDDHYTVASTDDDHYTKGGSSPRGVTESHRPIQVI